MSSYSVVKTAKFTLRLAVGSVLKPSSQDSAVSSWKEIGAFPGGAAL